MRRRRQRPAAADARPPWALLSFLLRYPDERLVEARDEIAAEVASLPDGPLRAALERFLAGLDGDATSLAGRYVYADLCEGELRSLVPDLGRASGDRELGLHVDSPSSFGEDLAGHVYVASLAGPVYRLVPRR